MPELHTVAIFLPAALLVLIIPGPAVLFLVARSIEQGRGAGVVSIGLIAVIWAAVGLGPILSLMISPGQGTLLLALPALLVTAFLLYLVFGSYGWYAKRFLKRH